MCLFSPYPSCRTFCRTLGDSCNGYWLDYAGSSALCKVLWLHCKHARDSCDDFPMHKHNHPASSKKSLWEGQEYEKESVAVNKLQVLLEEAVFIEHRVTLTLGTHIPVSPSICICSRLPLLFVKPFCVHVPLLMPFLSFPPRLSHEHPEAQFNQKKKKRKKKTVSHHG